VAVQLPRGTGDGRIWALVMKRKKFRGCLSAEKAAWYVRKENAEALATMIRLRSDRVLDVKILSYMEWYTRKGLDG